MAGGGSRENLSSRETILPRVNKPDGGLEQLKRSEVGETSHVWLGGGSSSKVTFLGGALRGLPLRSVPPSRPDSLMPGLAQGLPSLAKVDGRKKAHGVGGEWGAAFLKVRPDN